MKDFDKEFDKAFNRTQKVALGLVIFNCLLGLGVVGGIGFVVFKTLQYFGVL